ncbi:MAG: serine/threonine-protein kinase [Candidatus Margulisiibacteriota bacterium]
MNKARFLRLGFKYFNGQAVLAEHVRAAGVRSGSPIDKISNLDRRFRIDQLLAGTRLSSVYQATDRESGQPVAVKRMHSRQDDHIVRWETGILKRLNHPNIVRLVAGGPDYLVEELIPGRLLGHLRLSPLETLVVGWQLVNALRYLDGEGIILRDLKPTNIMITPDGVAKLFDFGLAKDRNRPHDVCSDWNYSGTPGYAAPELIACGTGAASLAADYFALGVSLYEALTGQFPYVRQIRVGGGFMGVSFPESGHPLGAENLKRVPSFLHYLLYKLLEPEESRRLADPDLVEWELIKGLDEAGAERTAGSPDKVNVAGDTVPFTPL